MSDIETDLPPIIGASSPVSVATQAKPSIDEVPVAFLVAGGIVNLIMATIRPYGEALPSNIGSVFAGFGGVLISLLLLGRRNQAA